MNKQEFQQTIRNMKPPKFFAALTLNEAYEAGFEEAKGTVLFNFCFLNEPEKPTVPQYVADWYEDHKGNLEYNLYLYQMSIYDEKVKKDNFYYWMQKSNNPVHTLVNMHQFGYEIEKEKLYIAQNKQSGEYICYCFGFFHSKNPSSKKKIFTAPEDRWKELGYWGNDLYIFEEVEGEDD